MTISRSIISECRRFSDKSCRESQNTIHVTHTHTHTHKHIYIFIYLKFCCLRDKKVKAQCSRYRPGVAQSVGRGIALLFHDCGTRRWCEWSAARPGRTLPPGKTCCLRDNIKKKRHSQTSHRWPNILRHNKIRFALQAVNIFVTDNPGKSPNDP